MENTGHVWVIVLAGGSGLRLQTFLRRRGHERPIKQFCAIIGRRTMLQHTWERAEMIAPRERVLTVVDAGHARAFRDQLACRPQRLVIQQPMNRETGPGTLLPLAHVLRVDTNAIVAVVPADHFIVEEARFIAHVRAAAGVVRRGVCEIVVLGMPAARPDPDYGWIEIDRDASRSDAALVHVARFWEKPALSTARWLHAGGHLVSTMVTVARAGALWDLLCDAEPALRRPFDRIRNAVGEKNERVTIRKVYARMPSVSLSRGGFERLPSRLRAWVMRDVHWSDWGREERINETLQWLDTERRHAGSFAPLGAETARHVDASI